MRIIGYSSIDKILVASPGVEHIDISQEIAMVMKKRGCAGRWEGDEHVPCDSGVGPFCSNCSGPPDPCVMCRGECQKPEKTCTIEHSVYLAVFSPTLVKVGVTKTRRLETRLKEQGADIGLEIARFPDGELARKRERELSSIYPDRLSYEDKLEGVSQNVSGETLQKLYQRYDAGRILHFEYFKEKPWMKPIIIEPHENTAIAGRVLGIKGKAAVIEKRNTLYAINLDSLIGFDFEPGKGSIKLQTSLLEYT
jgi:hypothetical protein